VARNERRLRLAEGATGVLSGAFAELGRQVASGCVERGRLLMGAWTQAEGAHRSTLRAGRGLGDISRKLHRLEREKAAKIASYDKDKVAEMAALRAAHAEEVELLNVALARITEEAAVLRSELATTRELANSSTDANGAMAQLEMAQREVRGLRIYVYYIRITYFACDVN